MLMLIPKCTMRPKPGGAIWNRRLGTLRTRLSHILKTQLRNRPINRAIHFEFSRSLKNTGPMWWQPEAKHPRKRPPIAPCVGVPPPIGIVCGAGTPTRGAINRRILESREPRTAECRVLKKEALPVTLDRSALCATQIGRFGSLRFDFK